VKRISEDAVQQALAEHTAATKPHHTDTSKLNDYTKSPTLWNAPTCSIAGRAARHEEIREANATAKPVPATLTAEEQHQQLVERRRAAGNTKSLNRLSFRQRQD